MFKEKAVMPIANVFPLSIVGGSVTFSTWQKRYGYIDVDDPPIRLVAARVIGDAVEDAAIVPLIPNLSYTLGFSELDFSYASHGEDIERDILYQCELFTATLESKIIGRNPFTGISEMKKLQKREHEVSKVKAINHYVENINHLFLFNPHGYGVPLEGPSSVSIMLTCETELK